MVYERHQKLSEVFMKSSVDVNVTWKWFHPIFKLSLIQINKPLYYLMVLSDSREVLEARTVTLAPDRNWKAKLFPSLSPDEAESSAEGDRKK